MLDALQGAVVEESYFGLLIGQWSQESTKESSSLDLIADNVTYIKSLGTVLLQLPSHHIY